MSRFLVAVAIAAAGSLLLTLPAQAQNAENGQKVFKQQCSICHDVAAGKNKIGPSLFSVVGGKAGSGAGFTYSDGNKNSGITWDEATLDKFLTDPRGTVAGTKMTYAGVKNEEQRKDLIGYLATLH
jgi:cytochrome c